MTATAFEPNPQQQPIRLLVVEDSEIDFEMLTATLHREGLPVSARRVEDRAQMIRAMAEVEWDAVISDHHLPNFSSGEALMIVRASRRIVPFIVVSGMIGEEAAVAAMRAGADDYLIKGRLARLVPALLNAMSSALARRERESSARALAASEQRLRELLAHLETVVDRERSAIAREVHDDVGGLLTALRFDLAWIERHGDGGSADRARHAMQTVVRALQAAQRIQQDLRPPVLDDGILPALAWQIGECRRNTGLDVEFSSNVESLTLDNEAGMTVFRTLQESLTNIAKHARASRVRVGLIVGSDQLSLEIVDDGVGIAEHDLEKTGSFGLRGLAERARCAGGWIDVSAGRQGTCVLLSLPLARTPRSLATSPA